MDKPATLSAERKRLLELRLQGARSAPVEARRISRRSGGQRAPLSFGQHQLWVLDQMNPGNSAYNIPFAYRICGELNVQALEDSINQIVQRHESWRTTFPEVEGTPVQEIHLACRIQIRITDLANLPAEESEQQLLGLASDEGKKPFDLRQLPLVRASLFKLGEAEHVLLINVHHIICDVWSCAVFARELTALYAAFISGQPNPLPELTLQYGDYAQWQREKLADAAMASHLAFWRKQLGGDRAPLPVPADRPRPARQSHRGGIRVRDLSAELARKARDFAREEGVTLFILTLAAFKALLARYSGETDICIGSPIAQRPDVETEGLIGYFLNMLALRSDLSGDPDFRELLRRVRSTALDAFQHQDAPFEKIVEDIHPSRDLSRQPIFQIAFVLLPAGDTAPSFSGTKALPFGVPVTTAKFDLTLFIEETPGGMRSMLEYATDQFEAATADRMIESLELLLEGIVADPSTPLSRLPILGAAQRQRILTEWSGSERPYPRDQTIAARFAECAAKTPDAIAVIEDGTRLTYGELDARANRVAHFLQSRGIRAGEFVGLRAERSLAFVVKVLGIAKAGAAYLPLDEKEPAARLEGMKVACAFILDAEPEAAVPADPVAPAGEPDGPAYVLFTSGSTGVPKGVIIPHRGITRLVVNNDYAPFQPDDVVAFASNVCFDAATFEIWGALLNGAALVITPRDVLFSPEALQGHLTRHRVSVLFLTTSLFNHLAHEASAMFRDLRILVFGGEAADAASVRLVMENGRPQRLVNGYGPTETTTFAICHVIERIDDSIIPIGRPIANTRVFLLDELLQPVPVGVAGEIYIGGPGVALGYHLAPELTAAKFVETPYGRLYRTGDVARWRPDGVSEYLGRIDQQVKIRGFRIEPSEIESVLLKHPDIRQAAVVSQNFASGENRLVAYMVKANDTEPAERELRAFLRRRLPAYMIPSAFAWLKALPMNHNGKLDAKALPPVEQHHDDAEFLAPAETDIQKHLLDIWVKLLNRRPIGIRDSFFDHGGHSLLALRLLGEIRHEIGVEIPVRRLFEEPTIEGLAEYVSKWRSAGPSQENVLGSVRRFVGASANESAEERIVFESPLPQAPAGLPTLITIQRGEAGKRPFFLVPGGWGGEDEFLVYAGLVRYLDLSLPLYGLRARASSYFELPDKSVEQFAAEFIRDVRRLQPEGPYMIGGECVGGVMAYEMARQLEADGQEISLMLLLNTSFPSDEVLCLFNAGEASYRQLEGNKLRRTLGQHWAEARKHSPVGMLRYAWHHLWPGATERRLSAFLAGRERLVAWPRLLLKHRPKPYTGRVTIIQDEISSRGPLVADWGHFHPREIDGHVVVGDHISCIREYAPHTAAKLREIIHRANLESL